MYTASEICYVLDYCVTSGAVMAFKSPSLVSRDTRSMSGIIWLHGGPSYLCLASVVRCTGYYYSRADTILLKAHELCFPREPLNDRG